MSLGYFDLEEFVTHMSQAGGLQETMKEGPGDQQKTLFPPLSSSQL